MEKYNGVKFYCKKKQDTFIEDHALKILNYWAWLFSQLGLTPIHSSGAYGNMSYRFHGGAFVITRAGMIPNEKLDIDNFSLVQTYDRKNGEFCFSGKHQPSSECFLHDCLYQNYDKVNAVLHGHSELINRWADMLMIPTTATFYDYGTSELADSALEIFSMKDTIIILKDHGFVAAGSSIEEAGCLVLEKYRRLLSYLQK